jgi:putative SOS response-associated peptidase YedK
MCGRFSASFDLREIRIHWGIHSDFSLFAPRFNIAPAQNIAGVLNHDGTRDVKLMQWALFQTGQKMRRSVTN